jgi:hypothetical protein
MIKEAYFCNFSESGWPDPRDLESFFRPPNETTEGKDWLCGGSNDSWNLKVRGLYGTDGLPEIDQVKVILYMSGHPVHGVYFQYDKWDGRIKRKQTFFAKGDLSRLFEFVRTIHGDPLSIGLFVPFPVAWKAVKEFIETDGGLPKSIEWLAGRDVPVDAFRTP